MDTLSRAGRYGLGAAVAAAGLMQVINGAWVRLVPALPGWMPASPAWAVLAGLWLALIGGAILTGHHERLAAAALAGSLLLSFVIQRIPELLANPGAGYVWTNPAKVLALAGGALRLAGGPRPVAVVLLGAFLGLCGAQHFAYAAFVDALVPGWIPPGPRFWTNFTAVALLAGGAGLLWPRVSRPAAILSGLMIFLWVLLLHLPRSVEMKSASELAGATEALGLAGTAWLVAGGGTRAARGPATA